MKKIILLLIAFPIFGQENIEFIAPEDVKQGMKGYALTVFQGTEPERMEVEVIANMPNIFPKSGMILVKLSGEKVERSRVAAGMSGSPVYIEGKLLGALAYTWSFSRELIAGITPIRDMISDKTRSKNVAFGASPIKTAWAIHGFNDQELIKELDQISQKDQYRKGIEVFKTVPSSRKGNDYPFKPGDSVAIKLMEGDLSVAAIGTVTYVDGEDVYIFGHPMDSEGSVSLPLARSRIYDIMSSVELSFKLGTALETVGSTVFDGLSAVYGRLDKEAAMVPVRMNIISGNKTNDYNFRMARSRKYLPTLMRRGIGAVINRELGKNIEKKVKLSWSFELTNNQVISNQMIWVKNTPLEPGVIKQYWHDYISLLWNNNLEHLVPESISMNLEILEEQYNYQFIDSMLLSRESYLPGETINAKIALRSYLGELQYTNMSIQIPSNMKQGSYTFIVGNPLDLDSQLIATFPHYSLIRSSQQLMKELRKPLKIDILRAMLVDAGQGGIAGSTFLPNLPDSKAKSFKHKDFNGNSILNPQIIKSEYNMKDPVLGIASTTIKIVEVPPVQ